MTSGSGKGAAKARTRGWGLLVLGSPRASFRGQKRMVPRAGKANWELGGGSSANRDQGFFERAGDEFRRKPSAAETR